MAPVFPRAALSTVSVMLPLLKLLIDRNLIASPPISCDEKMFIGTQPGSGLPAGLQIGWPPGPATAFSDWLIRVVSKLPDWRFCTSTEPYCM